MIVRSLALSGDLSPFATGLALLIAALGIALIIWELVRHRGKGRLVAFTGVLATVALLLAVLRPVRVQSRDSSVGPRVVVLVDRSMSMALPGNGTTRKDAASQALRALTTKAAHARLSLLGFGEGRPGPFDPSVPSNWASDLRSDLVTALATLASSAEESPSALVVISDGRLDLPEGAAAGQAVTQSLGAVKVPVNTVSVSSRNPPDASIRAVRAAGAAVAHQPLTLTVDVACDGGLSCSELNIRVQELVESGNPLPLAAGTAHLSGGKATVDLPITLDRAGARVVEVAIEQPAGDEIPDNNRRLLTFEVTRDRVRVLHIAGRPTYDVRALRTWLKSDASLDVVAFFILRTAADDVNASSDDLALIRFPVDELFTEHLSSFDAVVLQDFPSGPYGLTPYFNNIVSYIDKGGGLIMVGGLNAFAAGGYAGTPMESVLPVSLVRDYTRPPIDNTPFVPQYTAAGKGTPVLEALRGLLGDELPTQSGTNLLGDPHPGSVVLWEHPSMKAPSGGNMPVLALGEKGNGRTLALSVDDTHKLAFSEMAARTAGRGYGLLWDALLGWLMRDPRYEPARLELAHGCRADVPAKLQVRSVPGVTGPVQLSIAKLGKNEPPMQVPLNPPQPDPGRSFEVQLPPLPVGAYAATVRVGSGPATRRDFACERGGDEWADSRPDPDRLVQIAKATGGDAVTWKNAGSISFPPATRIASERHVSPILAPWLWTIAAALLLGVHWIVRRKVGLA